MVLPADFKGKYPYRNRNRNRSRNRNRNRNQPQGEYIKHAAAIHVLEKYQKPLPHSWTGIRTTTRIKAEARGYMVPSVIRQKMCAATAVHVICIICKPISSSVIIS